MNNKIVLLTGLVFIIASCQSTPVIVTERVKTVTPSSGSTSTVDTQLPATKTARWTSTPFQTSTPTPKPTATDPDPTPSSTNTPMPIFSLYDDFSSGSSSRPYDSSLWAIDPTGPGIIEWQRGSLVFSGTDGGIELKATDPQAWKLADIGTLQADMRIDSVQRVYGFTKLFVHTSLSDGKGAWWAQCRVGSNSASPTIICDSYRWKDESTLMYSSQPISIQLGKFYTVAIEVAPDGSFIKYYVDGKQIGYYEPPEKDLLVDAVYKWTIGLWLSEGGAATGAVDNVMVGPQ
jgi:hypothetical protein